MYTHWYTHTHTRAHTHTHTHTHTNTHTVTKQWHFSFYKGKTMKVKQVHVLAVVFMLADVFLCTQFIHPNSYNPRLTVKGLTVEEILKSNPCKPRMSAFHAYFKISQVPVKLTTKQRCNHFSRYWKNAVQSYNHSFRVAYDWNRMLLKTCCTKLQSLIQSSIWLE